MPKKFSFILSCIFISETYFLECARLLPPQLHCSLKRQEKVLFLLSQLAPNILLQQDCTTCYLTHQMLSVMLRIKVTVYRLMVQVPHQQRPFCVSRICFWYCSSGSFLRVHVLLFTQKLTMSKCTAWLRRCRRRSSDCWWKVNTSRDVPAALCM